MNDPVTNVEIEDVLSSIRRLVSENARAEGRPEKSDPSVEPQAEMAEAVEEHPTAEAESEAVDARILVLSPALRVGGEESNSDVVDISASAEEETKAHNDPQAMIEDLKKEVEFENDHAVAADEAPQEEAASDLDGLSFIHSEGTSQSPDMSTLADRIAGLEAAVAEREDNWEPDGISDDDNAGAPVEALSWEDSDEPMSHWEAEGAVEEAELVSDQVSEPAMDLSEFSDTDIETGAQADAVQVEPEAPQEQIEPVAENEPDEADPQLSYGLEPETDLFGGEESLIDEEILRDMVAEIVRQELQGSLGERITRNVRKLVRREIHRAMAARELD